MNLNLLSSFYGGGIDNENKSRLLNELIDLFHNNGITDTDQLKKHLLYSKLFGVYFENAEYSRLFDMLDLCNKYYDNRVKVFMYREYETGDLKVEFQCTTDLSVEDQLEHNNNMVDEIVKKQIDPDGLYFVNVIFDEGVEDESE